jgi:hypothetical protein
MTGASSRSEVNEKVYATVQVCETLRGGGIASLAPDVALIRGPNFRQRKLRTVRWLQPRFPNHWTACPVVIA